MYRFDNTYVVPRISEYTSRSQVDLINKFDDLGIECVPIIVSNMDIVGTYDMAEICNKYNILTCIDYRWNLDDFNKSINLKNVIRTFGFNTDNNIIINNSLENSIICLDTPNGYMRAFAHKISLINKERPDLKIMAGNVITTDGCKLLIDNGAKLIKIGVGSGTMCNTTKVTGIELPQLQAIYDCVNIIYDNECYLVSDGGCKEIGDFIKCFVNFADFVMAGTFFAGHKECKIHDKLYGMSSKEANDKYNEDKSLYYAYEGQSSTIEFKGSVETTINQLLGGLRSACTYTNAKNCNDLCRASYLKKDGNE